MKINFIPDPPILSITLNNGCTIHQTAHPQTNAPVTEENFLDVAKAIVSAEDWNRFLKLQGIEFEGVFCSATSEDMWGLNCVYTHYQILGQAFHATRFVFSNGNVLTIDKDNIQAFMSVWMPFRQSFFVPSTGS